MRASPNRGKRPPRKAARVGALVWLAAPRRFWPAAALLVGAVLLVYRELWPTGVLLATAFDHCDRLFADFVRTYYPQARTLLATHAPMAGYFYPPFFAIALLPLGRLPLPAALEVWGVLQAAGAAALCVLPARRLLRETGSAALALLYVFAFATAHPVLHNFVWGQVSGFVTLGVVAAVFAHADGRRAAAGGLVGLAASLKYYPAVIAIQFALRRDGRALLLAAAVAIALLVIVPAVVLGPADALRFQQLATEAVQRSRWISTDPNSQYFAHVVQRLTGANGAGFWPVSGWLVAGQSGYILWQQGWARGESDRMFGPIVLLLTVPFVLPTCWPHYFVFLPFCQVFLLRDALGIAAPGPRRALSAALLGSLWLSSVLCFLVVGERETYSRLGLLFFSDALALVAAWGLAFAGPHIPASKR